MTITLPLPPTANNYYRGGGKGDRGRYVTTEGRLYREKARDLARGQRVAKFYGEIAVSGVVYMARRGCDLDNRIKPTLDALKGIAWTDDRQVARLAFTRELDPRNPRVVLTIEEIQQEAA